MKKTAQFLVLYCFAMHLVSTSEAQQIEPTLKPFRLEIDQALRDSSDLIERYFWSELGQIIQYSKKVDIVADKGKVFQKTIENWEREERYRALYFVDSSIRKIHAPNCILHLTFCEDANSKVILIVKIFKNTTLIAEAQSLPIDRLASKSCDINTQLILRKLVIELLRKLDPELHTMRNIINQDALFKNEEMGFKILVLPFRYANRSPEQKNSIGYFLKEGLLKESIRHRLDLNPKYLESYTITPNFDETHLHLLMEYHGADMLIEGDYLPNEDNANDDEIGFRILVNPSIVPISTKHLDIPVTNFVPTNNSSIYHGIIPNNTSALVTYISALAEIYHFNFRTAQTRMDRLLNMNHRNLPDSLWNDLFLHAITVNIRMGDVKVAKQLLKKAYKYSKSGEYDVDYSLTLQLLHATTLLLDLKLDEALRLDKDLLQRLESRPNLDTSLWLCTSIMLQYIMSDLGNYIEAISIGSKTIPVLSCYYGKDRQKLTSLAYTNLGSTYNELATSGEIKFIDSAKYYLNQALDILLSEKPVDSIQLIILFNNLGVSAELDGQMGSGITYFNEGLAIGERILPFGHQNLIDLLYNLGTSHAKIREDKKSIEYLLCAEKNAQCRSVDLKYIKILEGLSSAYAMCNDFSPALSYLKKVEKLLYKYFNHDYIEVVGFHALRMGVYWRMKDMEKVKQGIQETSQALQKANPLHPICQQAKMMVTILEGQIAKSSELGK